jgi:dolichyl-phosphate-mannose-protein mannosyltransferase
MNLHSGMAIRPRVIGISALYLGLVTMVFFLAFCNLDGRLFWEDEAETALLAKNILKFGIPRVDDGVNHISVNGYRFDERNGVWTWSPWLPQYITAASFAVFGPGTWAGRAPFALIGWLSVVLLGVVAWKIYRSHRVALSCMLLLGTSEVFLLHIRQCRYYSIIVLGEILVVYGMYQTLAKKRAGSWFVLAGLLLQFYCTYISALANVPVLLVLAYHLFRQKNSARYPLSIALGIWVLLSVPWLLYTEAWRQESAETHATWQHFLRFYSWQFHFHFFPWCVVLLPAGGWLLHRLSKNAPATRLLPDILSRFEKYLVLLMLLYVPVLATVPLVFSRYLLPLLPVACLLVASWLFRYLKWTALAIAVLMVQCLSNVFAVATDPFSRQYPLRSPFADFLFSSLLPYEDRLSDLLKFFREQAHPGDVLVSWDPELPLAFYTKLKVVDARLASPVHSLPRWILPESATGNLNEKYELPGTLKPYYEKMTLTVHNSFQVDNIPEPEAYELQTAISMSPFVVYKLKDEAVPAPR